MQLNNCFWSPAQALGAERWHSPKSKQLLISPGAVGPRAVGRVAELNREVDGARGAGEFGPEADRARGDACTLGAELPVPAVWHQGAVWHRGCPCTVGWLRDGRPLLPVGKWGMGWPRENPHVQEQAWLEILPTCVLSAYGVFFFFFFVFLRQSFL